MDKQRIQARGKESVLQKRFLSKVLKEEGTSILEKQTRVIDKDQLIVSRRLKVNREFKTAESPGDFSGTLSIRFPIYLRFLDMKPKPNRLRRLKGRVGSKQRVKAKRKQYHLYNRIVFGHFSEIQKRLSYGLSDSVKVVLLEQYEIEILS
jgi:hypothetical protein